MSVCVCVCWEEGSFKKRRGKGECEMDVSPLYGAVCPHTAFPSAITPPTTFVESLPLSLDCKHLEGGTDAFLIIFHSVVADQGEGNRKTGVERELYFHILRVEVWNHVGRSWYESSVFMAITTI